jgi:hypothetical protein
MTNVILSEAKDLLLCGLTDSTAGPLAAFGMTTFAVRDDVVPAKR